MELNIVNKLEKNKSWTHVCYRQANNKLHIIMLMHLNWHVIVNFKSHENKTGHNIEIIETL